MSADKPKGPAKPFLGDEELASELDAWDATFDALHGGDEAAAASGEHVMTWPEPRAQPPESQRPTTPPPTRVPEPALATPDRTLDDFAPAFDEQPAMDADVEDRTRARPRRMTTGETLDSPHPGETDFSELGADAAPAALGAMLGASRSDSELEDDGVYTSASRPNHAPPDESFPEDPIAPPPKAAPVVRRTAAIVRRTPLSIPVVTPPEESDSFSLEQTRIADSDEMEARVQQTRGQDARSKAPTAPPPMSFTPAYEPEAPKDDDEYEIEIAADTDTPVDEPVPEPMPALASAPSPRRTVAHVVRRPEQPKQVSQPIPRAKSPIVEVEAPDEEDDFSDVAAAVGASDELEADRHHRPTPPGGLPAVHHHPRDVDEALLDDDAAETRALQLDQLDGLGESEHGEDAYVPMDRSLDEALDIPEERPHSKRPPSIVDFYPRVKTPTSVPPLGQPMGLPSTLAGAPMPAPARPARIVTISEYGEELPDIEPAIDLDAVQLPEQLQPLPSSQLDEDAAQALLIYERELTTVDETAASAALRVEAGRLSERLGDNERARSHYDAALLVDPRATTALRGLRRIARASGDLVEATRQLDAELAVAGALERRPLGHYRIDLLLASGEQDLARVAVGELLDGAPSDVRALLAQLELAFLDGRADEFGIALDQLSNAVADPELRAAVQSARGVLAAHQQDAAGAATWFSAAAESDPGSLGARLGAIRQLVAASAGEVAAQAYLDLARQVEGGDPQTGAALALRAQHWTIGETAGAAASLAALAMPADPLVARIAAETALAGSDVGVASAALASWAACEGPATDRAYAAARAAELDPSRGVELWGAAIELDPGDDYAAAQLRTAHVAAEMPQLAIEVDLAIAADPERDRARLRAAFGLIAQGQLDAAIELLQQARGDRPTALALAEALAEALAAAGKWSERAQLLGELAAAPGDQLDRDVAQLHSALAWEEAAGAAEQTDPDELQRATIAALAAWDVVLEHHPTAPTAHAGAIVLATRLGDRGVLGEVLARAQAAERSPWTASSLALRRARLVADDPQRAQGDDGGAGQIVRDALPAGTIDDPRRTLALVLAAARREELAEAASALDERAAQAGEGEAAALRLRAAQLALDAGDAVRASSLLGAVGRAAPSLGIVPDLLAAARRRAGDRSGPHVRAREVPGAAHVGDAFARLVRDGDLAASQNDAAGAVALYQHALELRPGDPLATVPLLRVAAQAREPAPIAALALAQLRAAEDAGDPIAKAEAYELLARIDAELRDDAASAQIALESASQADPSRVDLMQRLERAYTLGDQLGELLRLRRAELERIPDDLARDRAAMHMDAASLAERDRRSDVELTDLYRAALAADPRHRLALLHLESIVRRAGASVELAQLEEQIAAYFEGDPRTQAAFYTRAGETFAELGQIDAAVQRLGRADEVLPGHVPALEAWRQTALKGQLWLDVAEAASREANNAADAAVRAQLYHFAGVVLMDKALSGERATAMFRKALEADPTHKDAFLRLRILLEEDASHDELAILLDKRLEYEHDDNTKIELHRALAELHRNFLDGRDLAKQHYREILARDPNDLRAHAAIADISWEQGAWQDAADALIARAKLERDPEILKTLCFRLGLIYADRLVDVPMALKAFQRALTYQPDDELTLVRLADLATQAGEWKLALGACERLVKSEQDPDKRALHLHRVARIFRQGFGDMKRAERALNLALDGAPTNDEALSELVRFYRDAGDMTSVRVHLNRVAGTMRVRLQSDPRDGVAYRVIARAMAARAAAGVDGSLPIARAAAELADLLGASGDPERILLSESARIDLAHLIRPEAEELLFPHGVQTELRQLFALLGDRLAKHVGIDLRAYGVARGDRLRAKDSAVAAHAQDVASSLGFGEIDVYVSNRQPYAMVAEPTSPVSLVIGHAIAQQPDARRSVRFAAGAALKLAHSSLAIPARLAPDDLGVLTVALLRLFQPEFPRRDLEEAAVATQMQKLRRLIPTGLSNELRPYALAIDGLAFHHRDLARDLRIAGLRAGLVASGSVLAGLQVLAAAADTDVPSFLADPVAQGVIAFALGEDHANVAR
ncbi:MAG TPA: hypothetical protein VLX92_32870 [Kofleriaceae bacterium]|nr:hypothetical protein [Kofleriaceae bacterium]